MKRYIPKTRIICTIGPASCSEKILRKMMTAGMDVIRINFSHGSYSEYKDWVGKIKKINKRYRRRIKILGDLEGGRIRIGHFKNHKDIVLEKNRVVYLVKDESEGNGKYIPFDYKGDLEDLKSARFIYIDDGRIVLEIKEIQKDRIKTRVVIGGILKERKGINIPGAKLKFPPLTEKDKRDIEFAIENGFDFIAQSFVRNEKDILALKRKIQSNIKIIAKIENQQGIDNIDGIIQVSDGIMIARGDMGISIPVYKVPFVQKSIIKKCKSEGKFSITATQMLESMTENPFPTRAEVSDIVNAIMDGTDYLMLSEETAVGKYPYQCVKMMNDIIKYTEQMIRNAS